MRFVSIVLVWCMMMVDRRIRHPPSHTTPHTHTQTHAHAHKTTKTTTKQPRPLPRQARTRGKPPLLSPRLHFHPYLGRRAPPLGRGQQPPLGLQARGAQLPPARADGEAHGGASLCICGMGSGLCGCRWVDHGSRTMSIDTPTHTHTPTHKTNRSPSSTPTTPRAPPRSWSGSGRWRARSGGWWRRRSCWVRG